MKKRRKNRHAVALGRVGGLVRSEVKKRANRENGRKGWSGQKAQEENRRPAKRSPAAVGEAAEEGARAAIASIRARFGYCAIGLGYGGIRFSTRAHR